MSVLRSFSPDALWPRFIDRSDRAFGEAAPLLKGVVIETQASDFNEFDAVAGLNERIYRLTHHDGVSPEATFEEWPAVHGRVVNLPRNADGNHSDLLDTGACPQSAVDRVHVKEAA